MATLADIEEHGAALSAVTTLTIRELVEFWRTLDLEDVPVVAEQTREAVPEIIAAYSLASATLGADWYDALRDTANVAGNFTAILPAPVETERLQRILGWDLAPMFPQAPEAQADVDATLSRLAGSAQRLVAEADRAAIAVSTAEDPAAPRYARHASANACAFCALLATRQDAYRDEDSAGDKYHDNCHCVAVPVWDRANYEEAPYVAGWRDAYYDATEKLGGAADVKAILAEMRQSAGLR